MAHLGSHQVGVCLLSQADNVIINNRTWVYNQLKLTSCAALLTHIRIQALYMSVLLITLTAPAFEIQKLPISAYWGGAVNLVGLFPT